VKIDLAEAIATNNSYEDILVLFLEIDELMADSVFTDMVFGAFRRRRREKGLV